MLDVYFNIKANCRMTLNNFEWSLTFEQEQRGSYDSLTRKVMHLWPMNHQVLALCTGHFVHIDCERGSKCPIFTDVF